MACPFFMPTERVDGGPWPHPARLPLGAGWKGKCLASADYEPSDVELRDSCNLGYSRCSQLPPERVTDAVRFAVASNKDGQLTLKYSCERDHLPVDCGTLVFDLHQMKWIAEHGDPSVQRLAACYVDAYLTRQR